MATIAGIVQAIDSRLVEAREESRQLESARRALLEDRSKPGRGKADRSASRVRRAAGNNDTGGGSRADKPRVGRRRQAPRRAPAITSERIESTLAASPQGLRTAELARLTEAEHPRVLALLRELEANHRVQRSGKRRTTRWHEVTDEDRIAKRAAELAARR